MESNFEFCLIGKHSDVGRVRKANEDSMDIFDAANMRVFVVCDGMGGHIGGQDASQTAIAAIRDFMLNHVFADPYEAIHNSIIAANDAIVKRAQAHPELSGMGSTCVMLVVTSDGKVYYGHVGDSRIYIVINHQIIQLTKDHSYVQTLVDAGEISKEQAEHHPRKNEITNALGILGMQPPTLCNEPIEPEAGNCFVLCSDGLSGMVDDRHIERVVSKHEINIQQRTERLVQMANEAGGKDNITVQLVEFAVSSKKKAKNTVNKKLFLAAGLLAIVILAVLSIAYFIFFRKDNADKSDLSGTKQTQPAVQDDTIPDTKGMDLPADSEIPGNEPIDAGSPSPTEKNPQDSASQAKPRALQPGNSPKTGNESIGTGSPPEDNPQDGAGQAESGEIQPGNGPETGNKPADAGSPPEDNPQDGAGQAEPGALQTDGPETGNESTDAGNPSENDSQDGASQAGPGEI